MNLLTRAASALSFAHLAGIGKAKSAKAEDDDEDKKKRDGESEEDYAKRMKAAESDQDDEEKKDDKADDSGESEDAEGDDPEDDDGKDKKGGKKGKKAAEDEGDEDDDKEMRGSSPAAAARRRERARCASIFADKAAARNPQLAAQLAFNTAMPRSEALAVLRAAPAAAVAPAGGDRSARNPQLGPGGTPQRTSAQHVDASWDRAFAKVTPKSVRR